jgi:hypothetical protein
METEVIDKLFLELSQVTQARTGTEIRLCFLLAEAAAQLENAEAPTQARLDLIALIHRVLRELDWPAASAGPVHEKR